MICMNRFNYIITIHNKQDLISQVLNSILRCIGPHSHVYPVLDGCTDGTEAIIDQIVRSCDGLPITKIYAPDVHEIRAINTALNSIPQEGEGYNIIMQDDVILGDRNIEKKIEAIYHHYNQEIGMLSFRHGVSLGLDTEAGEIFERDLIETCYGPGGHNSPLLPARASRCMVAVRSPECISFSTVRKVGILDERYAPFTFDNHDYSIRCLKSGLSNLVYSMKFISRLEWGGMRRNPTPRVSAIMRRNRQQCYQDHGDFIASLRPESFKPEPVAIADWLPRDSDELALAFHSELGQSAAAYLQKRRLSWNRIREKMPF